MKKEDYRIIETVFSENYSTFQVQKLTKILWGLFHIWDNEQKVKFVDTLGPVYEEAIFSTYQYAMDFIDYKLKSKPIQKIHNLDSEKERTL